MYSHSQAKSNKIFILLIQFIGKNRLSDQDLS